MCAVRRARARLSLRVQSRPRATSQPIGRAAKGRLGQGLWDYNREQHHREWSANDLGASPATYIDNLHLFTASSRLLAPTTSCKVSHAASHRLSIFDSFPGLSVVSRAYLQVDLPSVPHVPGVAAASLRGSCAASAGLRPFVSEMRPPAPESCASLEQGVAWWLDVGEAGPSAVGLARQEGTHHEGVQLQVDASWRDLSMHVAGSTGSRIEDEGALPTPHVARSHHRLYSNLLPSPSSPY